MSAQLPDNAQERRKNFAGRRELDREITRMWNEISSQGGLLREHLDTCAHNYTELLDEVKMLVPMKEWFENKQKRDAQLTQAITAITHFILELFKDSVRTWVGRGVFVLLLLHYIEDTDKLSQLLSLIFAR